MTFDPKELRRTAVGGAVLRGLGGWAGAFVAVAAIYLLFVFVVNPWLETVEASDTQMFGPAEGWLVFLGLIVLGPPTVAAGAWIGLRSAQRTWSIAHATPKAWVFVVVGLPLSWFTAGIAGAIDEWASIVAIPIGFGVTGFLVSTSLRPPLDDRPPPPSQPAQTDTR